MSNFLIAITIGLIAGTIDVVPMLVQKLDKRDSISAFIHYFVLGVIIPFVHWGIPSWITGIIIAFFSALPIMIIVYKSDKKAIIPMLIFSLLLGAGIGFAGAKFIN